MAQFSRTAATFELILRFSFPKSSGDPLSQHNTNEDST